MLKRGGNPVMYPSLDEIDMMPRPELRFSVHDVMTESRLYGERRVRVV